MKFNSSFVLLVALGTSAPGQDKPAPDLTDLLKPLTPVEDLLPKPKPAPKSLIPESSEAREKLDGRWLLQSASLGNSLSKSLQKSAGANSTFTLGNLTGEYVATVDLKENSLTVEWHNWKMTGVAKRNAKEDVEAANKPPREFEMIVTVTGRQEYKINSVTDGEKPAARNLELELLEDKTTSQTTFSGIPIKSKVRLPALEGGQWSVDKANLYLLGTSGNPWKFDRKVEE